MTLYHKPQNRSRFRYGTPAALGPVHDGESVGPTRAVPPRRYYSLARLGPFQPASTARQPSVPTVRDLRLPRGAQGRIHRFPRLCGQSLRKGSQDPSWPQDSWPNGITCPSCGSDNVKERSAHPTMPHRCNSCRKFFSVKHGTAMQSSKIGYQDWAVTIYIVATGLKGTSSMKVHRDLGITQKSAWHLAHSIRQCFADHPDLFAGSVELYEAFFGRLEKNKHAKDRLNAGRATVGADQRRRGAEHRQGRPARLRCGAGSRRR